MGYLYLKPNEMETGKSRVSVGKLGADWDMEEASIIISVKCFSLTAVTVLDYRMSAASLSCITILHFRFGHVVELDQRSFKRSSVVLCLSEGCRPPLCTETAKVNVKSNVGLSALNHLWQTEQTDCAACRISRQMNKFAVQQSLEVLVRHTCSQFS